jgi:hypothetical protein
MRKEKARTPSVSRIRPKFREFRKHSEFLSDFLVDREPSFRMQAESKGTRNKADVAFEQLVNSEVYPSYSNAGLKRNVDRRYR